MLFTSLIISPAFSSVTCPPNSSYTLYPLYILGLCEAVITIPPWQLKCLVAKESIGVGLKLSYKYTFTLFAQRVKAAASANSFDIFLESYAIATFGDSKFLFK